MTAALASPLTANPTEAAREVIRKLALGRIPPTPENYARLFAEISGTEDRHPVVDAVRKWAARLVREPGSASLGRQVLKAVKQQKWNELDQAFDQCSSQPVHAHADWSVLVQEMARKWPSRTDDGASSSASDFVISALRSAEGDQDRGLTQLRGIVRSWGDVALVRQPFVEPGSSSTPVAPGDADAKVQQFRELLARTLEIAVVERLGYTPDLAAHARRLAEQCRGAHKAKDLLQAEQDLRQFWIRLELRGETLDRLVSGLLNLLRLMIGNLGELAGEDALIQAQLGRAQELIADPIDINAVHEAERNFREVAIRQGTMRHSLDEAKNALKSMVALFIDRVGALTLATGDFHQKVGGYVAQIEESDDLAKLSSIVGALLADTRMVHADMERTHDELQRTRQEAQAREARVRQLESELASLGDLIKVDPLTSVLNRRGLDEAFSAEEARAARSGAPLSMALLDVDNFKRLNDQYGHKTGDNALTHLAEILRSTIRPSDKVARFGGEEFVLLLPDTPTEEAVAVMTRVQRELTRRFFLHANEKILITFSAGVSQWRKGETKEQAFERADAAMYEAKRTGKNRVVCAPLS